MDSEAARGNLRDRYFEDRTQTRREWKEKSVIFFRQRNHGIRNEWLADGEVPHRLPTDSEIRQHRGWPTQGQEMSLRKMFFKQYKEKVAAKLPENFREKLTDEAVAYCYGIYLLNYVTGGMIISKYFDLRSYEKWKEKNDSENGDLSTDNLDDWPMHVRPIARHNAAAVDFGSIFTIDITMALGNFKGRDPNLRRQKKYGEKDIEKKRLLFLKEHKSVPMYSFSMSDIESQMLAGIEESHHALLASIQGRGLASDSKDFVSKQEAEMDGVLAMFGDKNDYLYHTLKYRAGMGAEYVAENAKALVVKRYLPDIWKGGYGDYYAAIRAKRLELKEL